MDMRSKSYPLLPKGRDVHFVLPRTGDLRFRCQLPHDFKQRLYIHADPRRRFWYSLFELQRKFIVMSTQGDLYVKNIVYSFTMDDLPTKNVLSMPRVARGDLVKALDLVQCSKSEGQRWELVFTRWRNGMETWLPVELVQLFAPDLMQEFYANSINSWAFHSRLQQQSLSMYRTEVELWLIHPEFQNFYKRLRQKQAVASMSLHPLQRSEFVMNQLPLKSEHSTASSVLKPLQEYHSSVPVATSNSDPSEAVIQEFEQRRLAREFQEQLDQNRRQIMLRQLQQRIEKQAEEQRNLHAHELERRLCHVQRRQQVHEELQRKQREYQQQRQMQQKREKLTALQNEERDRRQRAKDQEHLLERLQQNKHRQEEPQNYIAPIHERLHKATPPSRFQTIERQNVYHSSLQGSKKSQSGSTWVNGSDDEYVPSGGEKSDSSTGSFSEEIQISRPTRRRCRKRLLYSQVEVDDDDDDLPNLSAPPSRAHLSHDKSEDKSPSRKAGSKRRRLRQCGVNKVITNSLAAELNHILDTDDGEHQIVKPLNETTAVGPSKPTEDDQNEIRNDKAFIEYDDDNDGADFDDDAVFRPPNLGKTTRCVCGATAAGNYRGHWLQCSKNDCGVWEHADCVGFLIKFASITCLTYLCSRCDPISYLARCEKASHRLLDWLFQCCDSRNSKQLINLLKSKANASFDWKHADYESRTLVMHVARNGLAKCLCYLLDERNIDLYETDLQNRTVLHHAALGESVVCCQALLERDRKLLLHQDLRGCMPYHLMLQSSKLNRLCIPYIRLDAALVGMCDLDSNFPIHYVCQAINTSTIEICQMILAAQPVMLQEKSSEGIYPLMILCKAAGNIKARSHVSNVSEIFSYAKRIIALMLDVDVFGDCLNQKAPNGWSPLHFAAASGNHELVSYLCNVGLYDVQYAANSSGQTALHVAAQNEFPLCVRALLLEGLNIVAKDTIGFMPILHTKKAFCIREFMHFKLTKQLSRLHRMLGRFNQRGIVHRWQRLVAQDPICFDILNDWCRRDPERIERMDGLLLSNPFLLRLDNKINYVMGNVVRSIKKVPGNCLLPSRNGNVDTEKQFRRQKIVFVFSRESRCFWKQFIGMARKLEPEDFRLPMVFSIKQDSANSQINETYESNVKLVLIQIAAGLLKEAPGLLLSDPCNNLKKGPLLTDKDSLSAQLLTFFILGELVAHFVLFEVAFSGILDFNEAFLRCVCCNGKFLSRHDNDNIWINAGRCFAAGFDGVLPATLSLFHANELSVLFNVSNTSINVMQIDWSVAVDWNICRHEELNDTNATNAKEWFPRLMKELVKEERLLVLLFMTGTFHMLNEHFFRSDKVVGRITIECRSDVDRILNQDAIYPMMEHGPDVLRIPPYSSYDAFKIGFLSVIRHTYHAFLPE
ncbi:putative HECT domain, Zinc finger, PHD-type, Zinc finger, FYVE/PHD-type [Plasmopara halstedii]